MSDTNAAAQPLAAPTHAPIDLTSLKDDLGIAAGDTSQDAWLQRRVDGVWARIEQFCFRKLCAPPVSFIDDWGQVTLNGVHYNEPPPISYMPTATVYLRNFPVAAITAVVLNGTSIGLTKCAWEAESGKLLALDQAVVASAWGGDGCYDLTRRLLYEQAKITYTAGWATLPADLYECVLGAMQVQWAQRQAQLNGGAGGLVTQIDIQDVGSVQYSSSPNAFVEGTLKGVGTDDPLLGPWANNLLPYRDWRQTIGSEAMPTTVYGP